MIDYLLKFDDADTATAWVAARGYDDTNTAPCRVYTDGGTVTVTDPETGATSSEPVKAYLPYAYIWLALPDQDDAIAADPACFIAADRDAHARGDNFVLQSVMSSAELADYFIEPTIAGATYPFGSAAAIQSA